MAIFYPDNLQHNNPNKFLVDITEIKGTSYPIGVLSETGSIPTDKRNIGQIIFVSSSQQYFGYYGITTSSADWDNTSNWRTLSTFSGSFTGSLLGTSSWADNAISSSFASTASLAPSYLPILGGTISGSLVIQNNLTVLGSASIQFISESTLNIGTNLITVNTLNPGARFGGLAVIDSGSSPQVSASFLYDSQQDEFIFVHKGTAAGPITSSHFVLGPETYNDLGNEIYLTVNRIPKGTGIEHLNDSNISDNGSVVSINSNSEITGSLIITQGITGSLLGTSSWADNAISSSFASTASFAQNAISSSFASTASFAPNYILNSSTSSFVLTSQTSSFVQNSQTSSFYTGSFTGSFTGSLLGTASYSNQSLSSSFSSTASFAATASFVIGGNNIIEIQDEGATQGNAGTVNFTGTGVTATVTGSVATINISGIGGNAFPFTGSAIISGSLIVTGSTISTLGFTGSLLGTSSWANNAITASFVQNAISSSFASTSSFVLNAISSSFSSTASFVNPLNQAVTITGSLTVVTGSGTEFQVTNTGLIIGNIITDNHRITGSFNISGSVSVGLASPSARLHVRGTGTTSASLALRVDSSGTNNIFRVFDNGDVYSSAAGGTSTTPRIFGIGDLTTNTAGVFAFGDRLNSLGSHFGSRMLLQSFWGINIDVNRQNGGFKDLNNAGGNSQPCVDIFNSGTPLPTFDFGASLRVRTSNSGINSDPWLSSILELTDAAASTTYMRVHPTTGQVIFNGNSADAAAQLQIDSTTGGFLMPRMEGSLLEAISFPPAGLMGYANTGSGFIITSEGWWGYNGTTWVKINGAGGSGTTTNAITFNNTGSGDASGTTFDGSVAKTISYNTIGANKVITSGTSSPSGGVDGDIYLQYV